MQRSTAKRVRLRKIEATYRGGEGRAGRGNYPDLKRTHTNLLEDEVAQLLHGRRDVPRVHVFASSSLAAITAAIGAGVTVAVAWRRLLLRPRGEVITANLISYTGCGGGHLLLVAMLFGLNDGLREARRRP